LGVRAALPHVQLPRVDVTSGLPFFEGATMRLLAVAALVFCTSVAAAEDKKLSGTWSKKAEGFDLKIAFLKGDSLQFTLDDGNDGCVLTAKYTVDKDGSTVQCEVTKFEKKGNFPVEKEAGYKFSFKAEIKDNKAKISDFEGKDIDDQAKSVLEGDYVKNDK
jgi:hypothetical protein